MTGAAGGWEGPYKQLLEGIGKLKDFAAEEPDTTRKADLNAKIVELERRAENYLRVIRERGIEFNG